MPGRINETANLRNSVCIKAALVISVTLTPDTGRWQAVDQLNG
jgi:hypothetical protein